MRTSLVRGSIGSRENASRAKVSSYVYHKVRGRLAFFARLDEFVVSRRIKRTITEG